MRIRLFGFFFLVFPLLAPAQVYNVTRYATEHGLVQSQVMAILQDQQGYLWLGTHRGVDLFDGNSFQHIGAREGLVGNFFRAIVQDQDGHVWMASDGGITHFDGAEFRPLTSQTQPALLEDDVQALLRDQQGRIWIGYAHQGISLWTGDSLQHNPFAWEGGLPRDILSFWESASGRVWIGTRSGLYWQEGTGPISRLSRQRFPQGTEVYALLEDAEGILWIGTQQGLWWWDGTRLSRQQLPGNLPEDQAVYCMAREASGQIWIGTGNGIVRYQAGSFLPQGQDDRLLEYQMRSALVDDEGNIWFGTDGGGLRKITEGIFESYDMQDELTSNLAKSFLQDAQGRIWISAKDRGISVFDGQRVVQTFSGNTGLGGDAICTSYEDRRGHFWFASYNGTLTHYDGRSFVAYDRSDGLDANAVFWVSEGPNGHMWVGTDNGIFLFNGQRFFQHLTTADGLLSNTVYTMLHDAAGRMWIGTAEGLCRWEQGRFETIEAPGKVGPNVITMLQDPEGRVWVGSALGLACFEEDEAHWLKISDASGAHTVVALVVEGGRFLWVGTENGVYQLDLQAYRPGETEPDFAHYTQKDGLPSLECNANAAFVDAGGDLWIGTAEGAIHKPAGTQRRESVTPPRIYITQVRTSRDSAALGYPLLDRQMDQVDLPYTNNRLIFRYVGISLKSPRQVEYKFKLEPLDQDWEPYTSTRQTSVFYPNLDPGTYTFKVTARRESDPWDFEHYADYTFTIAPPFWATWWFITLMALLLLGLGWGIYYVIHTRRQRAREEQRIRNTAEKLQLEHQALYAMMNPHFTFNALQSIQFFIHRQDKKAANKFLSSFAKLVRKNLESTKVDVISLGEELDRLKLYLSLEKMRFPEKFDYEVRVDPEVDQTGIQLPPMLLQPFVENSIKHGIMPLEQDGLIELVVEQIDDDYLRIRIRDNGIGITASKARKADRPSDHVSKGMQITQDRLALFARMSQKRYNLEFRELKGEDGTVSGTEVEMILPLREDDAWSLD
ncbi:MAG: hypothetical protein D6722_01530 [Bacteroidetes bacterium]|nr:MAG: hypothetical protein D6722_01530 [Bacteroidota bacterium]